MAARDGDVGGPPATVPVLPTVVIQLLVAGLAQPLDHPTTLVLYSLAPSQPPLHLLLVTLKLHAHPNQRVPLLPLLPDQARNLFAVHQQLARSRRLVVD